MCLTDMYAELLEQVCKGFSGFWTTPFDSELVLMQEGGELEMEEEPEPAPYAKTLTMDRPW